MFANIPMLITTMRQQRLDVISGWRKDRKDPFAKNFVSRGANFLRKILINDGIHDSGCSLKVYKRDAFNGVTLYGEMHRFIPAILKIKGYRVGEAVVSHRARTAGETKYNYRRTLKGLIDMTSVWFWNRYAVRPLHLLGGIGILFMLLGGFSGIGADAHGQRPDHYGWADHCGSRARHRHWFVVRQKVSPRQGCSTPGLAGCACGAYWANF